MKALCRHFPHPAIGCGNPETNRSIDRYKLCCPSLKLLPYCRYLVHDWFAVKEKDRVCQLLVWVAMSKTLIGDPHQPSSAASSFDGSLRDRKTVLGDPCHDLTEDSRSNCVCHNPDHFPGVGTATGFASLRLGSGGHAVGIKETGMQALIYCGSRICSSYAS